jgi:hypothetical protein
LLNSELNETAWSCFGVPSRRGGLSIAVLYKTTGIFPA